MEGGLGDVLWSANPRYLIVGECGFDSCANFRLDTKRKDGVLDGPPYGPGGRGTGDFFRIDDYPAFVGATVVRRPHGTVVFGVYYSDEPPDGPHPIFEFDPSTGSIVTLVGGRPRVAPLDFDASGDHLLYLTFAKKGLELPIAQPQLFRYDGRRAVSLGLGFRSAVW